MSKVAIITDMEIPNKCTECNFLYSTCTLYCYLTKKDIDNVYSKPNWCPLKELPKEDNDFLGDEFEDGFTFGWNACLREITRE